MAPLYRTRRTFSACRTGSPRRDRSTGQIEALPVHTGLYHRRQAGRHDQRQGRVQMHRHAARARRLPALIAGAILITVLGSANAAIVSASPGSGSAPRNQDATAGPAGSAPIVIASTMSVQKLDPHVVTNFLDFQALGIVYDT